MIPIKKWVHNYTVCHNYRHLQLTTEIHKLTKQWLYANEISKPTLGLAKCISFEKHANNIKLIQNIADIYTYKSQSPKQSFDSF